MKPFQMNKKSLVKIGKISIISVTLVFLIAIFLSLNLSSSNPDWLSGYTTRKKLTINSSLIDDNLTDFPVLVKLTSSNFDFTKSNDDGFDIRFTSDDGTTLLSYERERHNSTNLTAEYWVKIPTVNDTVDTDFYMYYRTTDTADGADPTNVWDANYMMVQHMSDATTSTITDSTTNDNDGTKKAANIPIEADGKTAKGQRFNIADNAYIDVGSNASLDDLGPLTFSCWVYPFSFDPSSYTTIATKLYSNAGSWWFFVRTDTQQLRFNKDYTTTDLYVQSLNNAIGLNAWQHIIIAWDGTSTATNIRMYINGQQQSYGYTANGVGDKVSDASQNLWIGAESNQWYVFDGIMDEVRITNDTRTTAEIKADYNSEGDNLLTYGSEEGADAEYPIFSNYWDDNGTLLDTGTGLFNVTVTSTNGTVILHIDGNDIFAFNESADVYNTSYDFTSADIYLYNWTAYGNGTLHNLNTSANRYYTVNTSVVDTCTYTSGNWNVACTDNCTISSNVVGDTNANLTAVGNGRFLMLANITGFKKYHFGGGCIATCKGDCVKI